MPALTDWLAAWLGPWIMPWITPWITISAAPRIASWIGLVGAALVIVAALIVPLAAFWSRTAIGLARRGQLLVYAGLAALVACVPLPIAGYPSLPLAAYLRGLIGDLSVTSLLLLGAIVLARVTGGRFALIAGLQAESSLTRIAWHDRLLLLLAIAASALLLYPMALGATWLDPYRWGYGDSRFIAALLVLALLAWFMRAWLTVACVCAAVLAWVARTHESTNLWDYLIDPWLAVYALLTLAIATAAAGWRRARLAFSARDTVLYGAAALAWLSLGLYAREPWKADEGYSFGLVLSTVRDGHWLIPTLAGEPFLEKPPFVFWLAALSAKFIAVLTGQSAGANDLIPMHVAGRGANALIIVLCFTLIYYAALWCQRAKGNLDARADASLAAPQPWLAVLLLAATPAWLITSRYMTADLGFVLGAAMLVAGFAAIDLNKRWGGVLLGAGMTVGLLSKGLLLPGVALIVIALLVVLPTRYRQPAALRQLALALTLFVLLGEMWPLSLHQESPALFKVWLWDNNLDRFLGNNGLGPPSQRAEALLITAVYLLPLWPLAAWTLRQWWRKSRSVTSGDTPPARFIVALRSPLLPSLLLVLVWVATTLASSTFRGIYLLPAVIPLALLAAAALPSAWPASTTESTGTTQSIGTTESTGTTGALPLPTGVLRGLTMALFVALALACALAAAGLPMPWLNRGTALPDGAATRLLWPLLLAMVIFGLLAWKAYRRDRFHPVELTAVGLIAAAAVAIGLALPRADLGSGFSGAFKALAAKIDGKPSCIASRKLGESERAMFDYYADIRTVRFEIDAVRAATCEYVIEQVRPADRGLAECPGQTVRFSGARFADDGDRFRLCGPSVVPR